MVLWGACAGIRPSGSHVAVSRGSSSRNRVPSCRPCRRRGGASRDRRGTPNTAPRSALRPACRRSCPGCGRSRAACCAWAEIVDDHPDRDARATGIAGRAIGDRLAAAEAALCEQVVESKARSPTRCVNTLRSPGPGDRGRARARSGRDCGVSRECLGHGIGLPRRLP